MLSLKIDMKYTCVCVCINTQLDTLSYTLSGRVILHLLTEKQEIHLFEKPRGYKLKNNNFNLS